MSQAQGRIHDVVIYTSGGELLTLATAGSTVLLLNSVDDFDDVGGMVSLDGAAPVAYLSRDTDGESITLAAPLAADLAEGVRVNTDPVSREKRANVVVTNNDDEPIWALVGHEFDDKLDTGIREPELQESVELDMINGRWQITQIMGKEPTINGGMIIDLPSGPTSDGVVPDQVTGVSAAGGIRSVALTWPQTDNDDITWYRIYGSTASGFVVNDATNYIGEAQGNLYFAQKAWDPAIGVMVDLDPTKGPYFFQVVPVDRDGQGIPSAEVSGTPLTINSPDLAVGAVTALAIMSGSITADKFAAVLTITSKLLVGDRITQSDLDGIEIRTDTGVIRFPADGSAAMIYSDLVAFSLIIMDSLNIRGANNYLAGTLTGASGVLDPTTPATLTNYYPYKDISPAVNFWRARGFCRSHLAYTYMAHVTSFVPVGDDPSGVVDEVYTYDAVTGTETLHKRFMTGTTDPDWSPIINNGITWTDDGAGNYTYYVMLSRQRAAAADGVYDYKIRKYNQAFTAFTDTAITCPLIGTYEEPAFGRMSANELIVCWRQSTTSKLTWKRYTASTMVAVGAQITATTTETSRPEWVTELFAASGCIIVSCNDVLMQYNSTTGVKNTAMAIPHAPSSTTMTNRYCPSIYLFYGIDELDQLKRVYNYTWDTSFGAKTYRFRYTWYDGDPLGSFGSGGESLASPYKQLTTAIGACCRVDMPAPPDGGDPDDPDRLRIYGNTDSSAVYKLQGATAVGQQSTYFNGVSSGIDVPAVSGFAGRPGAVGIFRSAKTDGLGSIWSLAGNGPGRAGPLRWDLDGKSVNHPYGDYTQIWQAAAASSNIPNAAFTKIRCMTKTEELNGITHNNALNGGEWTIPEAGVYQITVDWTGASSAGGTTYAARILKGGAAIGHANWTPRTGNGNSVNVTAKQRFAAGDTFTVELYQNSGAALAVFGGSIGYQHVTVEKVRD